MTDATVPDQRHVRTTVWAATIIFNRRSASVWRAGQRLWIKMWS